MIVGTRGVEGFKMIAGKELASIRYRDKSRAGHEAQDSDWYKGRSKLAVGAEIWKRLRRLEMKMEHMKWQAEL